MPTKPAQRPMVDLDHLGQNVFLYEPHVDSSNAADGKEEGKDPPPRLIILCTWLGGATAKRIDKYITSYRQLFPNARILLIRTTLVDITWRSFEQIRARLAPARDAIRAILGKAHSIDGPDGRILLHIFSHGGCNIAIQLALSIREDGVAIPLRRVIFDCCPGDPTFRKTYNAAALSLSRGQPAQSIGRLALYPAIAAITSLQHLGIMASVEHMRAQLNDSAVFGPHARRLYLYSAADQTVAWQDVHSHLNAARARGYWADGVMFHCSPHCALILEDEMRYCAAIQNFWQGEDLPPAGGASVSTTCTIEEDVQNVTVLSPLRSKL
ncbi:hypothetical protein MMC17_005294 [Xylographa soralifera]|nr:hypothetical protein [Xylographa soralifera]